VYNRLSQLRERFRASPAGFVLQLVGLSALVLRLFGFVPGGPTPAGLRAMSALGIVALAVGMFLTYRGTKRIDAGLSTHSGIRSAAPVDSPTEDRR
jgi:drug/metabolite transporter (DMT)-like permease